MPISSKIVLKINGAFVSAISFQAASVEHGIGASTAGICLQACTAKLMVVGYKGAAGGQRCEDVYGFISPFNFSAQSGSMFVRIVYCSNAPSRLPKASMHLPRL